MFLPKFSVKLSANSKKVLRVFLSSSNISYTKLNECEDILKCHSDDQSLQVKEFRSLDEKDYRRFISSRASKREPALTREITSLAYKMGKQMISLAEGMPNEEVFPFSKIRIQSTGGREITLEANELRTALQYAPSHGLPSLKSTLQNFQETVHRPPALPRDVLVTNGAQHGIYACVELLTEVGDPVLVSQFTYTGLHSALKPYQPEMINIKEDENGIIPEHIQSVLEDRLRRGLRMPKYLYVVPTGNNPTGTVISPERRRTIYELACFYDFLIIEDDPYVFLNYTEKPLPSFLSLDTCGRVIRLDSVSKVISSGLRGGWLTAAPTLARQLELHLQAEILHPSTLSQVILEHIIRDKVALGSHLCSVRDLYRRRRDALHDALSDSLADSSLASWTPPDAGLFFWLKLKGVQHANNVVSAAFKRGLMVVPGQAFMSDSDAPCQHLRLTFSRVPISDVGLAVRHLADAIRDSQRASPIKHFATSRQMSLGGSF